MLKIVPVLALSAAALFGAEPFPMNGWQFHTRDVAKVADAIRRAPAYGVNFVIFSHSLFDHVEPFLNWCPSASWRLPG